MEGLCFKSPCAGEDFYLTDYFCPIEDDIICGRGTNYVYYTYKSFIALFVDFVLLMRVSSISKYEKKQIYLGFSITALHFFLELVFMALSCDINLIHDGCRDILGYQIAQIAISVLPPLILVFVEIHGLRQFRKMQRYFVDDELDQEQVAYLDHLSSDRNE